MGVKRNVILWDKFAARKDVADADNAVSPSATAAILLERHGVH
jgi:hypothetical protein